MPHDLDRDAKPVNLAQAQASLAKLDELAAEHPSLTTEDAGRRLGASFDRMPGDMAGRPPKTDSERKGTTLGVRFEAAEVARIDALMAALEARTPGVSLSRSDAVRAAVRRGLEVLERELGGTKKKR